MGRNTQIIYDTGVSCTGTGIGIGIRVGFKLKVMLSLI